jgi:ubiquinone biosynthesis protein COQ4
MDLARSEAMVPRRVAPPVPASRQAYLCAKALVNFVFRPTSRETFTALSESLVGFRANWYAVVHMLEDPDVAAVCRERYVGTPYVPADLIKYPVGSLGHELGAAMIRCGYDPAFYRDFYGQDTPTFRNDEEYLRFRVRQTHDIVHVLTGFGMMDFPCELGMQAFHAAQTRRPFSIALVGFGMLRILLKPDELTQTLQQVAKGFALGFKAKSLVAPRFEEQWSKPVGTWRKELNLTAEADYEF